MTLQSTTFAQFAVDARYSIFFYDPLGIGKSSEISGYVNQALIQMDILRQLSSLVRSGTLTQLGVPKSVVLAGHSFRSFISNALLGVDPGAPDAAVMTGLAYIGNATNYDLVLEALNPRIASTEKKAWTSLDTGYLTWVDVYANIINFFKAPFCTIDTAKFAESTEQPFAIMELLSLLALKYSAPKFTGPVLFFRGEFDYIVCGGFCPGFLEAGREQPPVMGCGLIPTYAPTWRAVGSKEATAMCVRRTVFMRVTSDCVTLHHFK